MSPNATRRIWPWAAALAIAITTGVLMPTADHHAAQAHADHQLQALQRQSADTDTHIASAAQALCESTHGPGAAHWWEGPALVCAAEQRATTVASTAGAKP